MTSTASRARAATARPFYSSNASCVSGSSSGGYEGLYNFSYGRGFCSSPYTYSASSSALMLTSCLLNIIGYSLPGLDANFDPLYNFTYNYGYCLTSAYGQEIFIISTPMSGVFATIIGLKA
ncbi:hypothetical protein QBC46DRAFT_339186 [Diplogelasinospora grovesii]|uniref:Uncharacterized protein n=1 Tax=Diplogelasinospora grovesii TaxID=303347 RepID=A0AAN6NBG1_9PEZI|nr:hypothetical protein QBC46DRAFT_339186 [Diplogelasinospora grovesii]